jgi:hypothetical protein
MAKARLSDVGSWGPTLTCRYVQLKSALLSRRAADFGRLRFLTDSVEKVANLESLQICRNTNDIFD